MMVVVVVVVVVVVMTMIIKISRITKTQFRIIHAFDDSFDDKILEYFSSEEQTISCCGMTSLM